MWAKTRKNLPFWQDWLGLNQCILKNLAFEGNSVLSYQTRLFSSFWLKILPICHIFFHYSLLSGQNPLIWPLHIPIIQSVRHLIQNLVKLLQTSPNCFKPLPNSSKPYPHLSKPCPNASKCVQMCPNASKRI